MSNILPILKKRLLMKQIQKYIKENEYNPLVTEKPSWEKLCSMYIWYEDKDMITDKQFLWCMEYMEEYSPKPVYKMNPVQLKLPYGEMI